MADLKRPRPLVSLERIGPTEPTVRDYVTDVGTLTVNFAQLERHIRQTVETVLHVEQGGVIELPETFREIYAQKGRRTLGRLVEELKALGVEPGLAMALGQVNADRISVIHEAAKLLRQGGTQVDYPAIQKERLRLRHVLKRVRSVYTGIEHAEIEIFEMFLAAGHAKHGRHHPSLVALEAQLNELRRHHALRVAQNPPPSSPNG